MPPTSDKAGLPRSANWASRFVTLLIRCGLYLFRCSFDNVGICDYACHPSYFGWHVQPVKTVCFLPFADRNTAVYSQRSVVVAVFETCLKVNILKKTVCRSPSGLFYSWVPMNDFQVIFHKNVGIFQKNMVLVCVNPRTFVISGYAVLCDIPFVFLVH